MPTTSLERVEVTSTSFVRSLTSVTHMNISRRGSRMSSAREDFRLVCSKSLYQRPMRYSMGREIHLFLPLPPPSSSASSKAGDRHWTMMMPNRPTTVLRKHYKSLARKQGPKRSDANHQVLLYLLTCSTSVIPQCLSSMPAGRWTHCCPARGPSGLICKNIRPRMASH